MYTINNLFNQPEEKKDRITKIVIPAIQRDYVQGLQEYSAKFDIFLNILFNGLIGEKKISLDFIYGNIHENGVFEPIDGQQRITTLALLYYYIVNIRQKKHGNNIFKHISYETRESATKFCKLLREDEFTNYLSENLNKNIISTIIKNYYKYYDIYDYDLTIESMINSLDKIENKYNEYIKSNQNFDAINDINFDNITFHIFPMESFNLSDDLYIKMNGRGKLLSSFDNFKADYFKWLEENEKNIAEDIIDIKNKFNNEYIDIFWDFTFENNNKIPDPEKLLFRFINRFIIAKNDLSQNIISDNFINDSEDINYIYNSFEIYKITFQNHHKAFITLLENLTKISNINDYFQHDIENYEENTSVKFNISDKLTFKTRFVYNYIMRFFEETNCTEKFDEAKKYARIIWNITEQYFTLNEVNKNSYITAVNGMIQVDNIKWDNIYHSFHKLEIKECKTHIQRILCDEIKKCSYIIEDPELEEKFKTLEQLPYLNGAIGFLLGKDKDDFNKIYDTALNVFSENKQHPFNIYNNNYLLNRAVVKKLFEDSRENDKLFNPFNNKFLKEYLISSENIRDITQNILLNHNSYLINDNEYTDFISKYHNDNDTVTKHICLSEISALIHCKIQDNYLINKYFIFKYNNNIYLCEIKYKKYQNNSSDKKKSSLIIDNQICKLLYNIKTLLDKNKSNNVVYEPFNKIDIIENEIYGFNNVARTRYDININFNIGSIKYQFWISGDIMAIEKFENDTYNSIEVKSNIKYSDMENYSKIMIEHIEKLIDS
ncbi:MAG TPA: DUF262 domain-containing protein [Candidatus Mucispirillum faecigallinarum]|uniref:DUF262 domain-containing protein n=1 Tax=Candidatus Mucispirillum faecigallinarum TaxID=2838699 RepID=A0A9D2KC00_9BACT|nr:DUF262 domain-containing protein [Candidatus Mucispirillum faecigallinarum]